MAENQHEAKSAGSTMANQNGTAAARSTRPAGLSAYFSARRRTGQMLVRAMFDGDPQPAGVSTVKTASEIYSIDRSER